MALVLADRVKETSTTFGLSDMVLLGAASGGYRAFNQVLSSGDTTYYCIVLQSANEWEVGIGTYSGVSNALTRNTVLSSSNNNNPVSFGIGTKDVFITSRRCRRLTAPSFLSHREAAAHPQRPRLEPTLGLPRSVATSSR